MSLLIDTVTSRDDIPHLLYVDDIVDTTKKIYEIIAILKAIGLGQ